MPEPLGSEEPSAELEAMQSIGRQSMLELIEKLSPEQQQVLTLKFVFNFPNADVAKILDKTEGAIKSLQHRALASLQKQIAQQQLSVALEVGIVGLPSSGKSMLFEALTGARASGEVGMAAIPDPRLQQLADVVAGAQGHARGDPRRRGARHRAGAARQPAPGRRAARRARRLLRHARPGGRPRDAEARAARRRSRPRRAAARAGREAGEVGRREAEEGGRASSSGCSRTSTRARRSPTGRRSCRPSSSR